MVENQKRNYSVFEMIAEKININSRASSANLSQADAVLGDEPASIKRKNNRLSFASLRQIFTRMRKSFLLNASSASIEFALRLIQMRALAVEHLLCC